jgi:glutamyl-tRNA reductase
MTLLCLSLHHIKTSYRNFSRVRFSSPSDFYEATQSLGERVLFQTGTRVEIYTTSDSTLAMLDVLSQHSGIAEEELSELFRVYSAREAAEHLFRLACCIESRVLGETYIPWQVEAALAQAKAAGATGGALEKLFSAALQASKRAREETGIAKGDLHLKALEALRAATELEGKKVLLYGAGLTGRRVAKLAKQHGASIAVLNRNYDIAQRCAREIGAEALSYEERNDALKDADILVCATLASHYRVTPELLAKLEREKRLVILDVSPFRNVSPEVAKLGFVTLVNGEVAKAAEENLKAMRAEVPKVEGIVAEELAKLKAELPELFEV